MGTKKSKGGKGAAMSGSKTKSGKSKGGKGC